MLEGQTFPEVFPDYTVPDNLKYILSNAVVSKVVMKQQKRQLVIHLKSEHIIQRKVLNKVAYDLKKELFGKTSVFISFDDTYELSAAYTLESITNDYWGSILHEVKNMGRVEYSLLANGEWGFEGLIMTDWNGGVSHPSTSMHAGNDMIMPGGAERAQNIVNGMQDAAPVFDERGQVAVDVQLMYGFVKVYSAKWNEFTPSAAGTKMVTTSLGEGYTATVADDGRILVNGEEIYLNYRQGWFNPGTFSVPATTDVVTVSNDGKTLTYKGEYVDNNIICLGDVQKSAINNLKVIMQSRDMARIYGTTTRSYTALCGDLTNYQTVNKSEITTERTLKENLDQAKKDLEEAKKNLEELQKQNAAKDAEIAKAKTEVEAAKKDLQAAKMAAKKAAVKSVKSKKAGKAIVTVKKVAGAEGYQVQYSLKKSMKSAKNVKIKKNSITIKRLKKGKTYYVRVRAFSKDSNGKQICTAWSTAKKVTIKK